MISIGICIGTVLFMVIIVLSSNSLYGEQGCKSSRALAAFNPSDPIDDWQVYEDTNFTIALELPGSWESKTTIGSTNKEIDPPAIIKRQTFVGEEGFIDLDIWLANKLDLRDWLSLFGITFDNLPTTEPNAKVAGFPALAFVDNSGTIKMLTVYFSDGKYIYRLWDTISYNQVGLQVYHHILDTISFAGSSPIESSVPEEIWVASKNAVEKSGLLNPLLNSCCGYNSPSNPFSCCDYGDHHGNCVWWVFYQYGWVPFRGNAGTWWNQVPTYYDEGWRRGATPQLGQNIAWWSGNPGHVAFVPNYTGGVNITISEMCCSTDVATCTYSCNRSRTISGTNPNGYIWTIYTK